MTLSPYGGKSLRLNSNRSTSPFPLSHRYRENRLFLKNLIDLRTEGRNTSDDPKNVLKNKIRTKKISLFIVRGLCSYTTRMVKRELSDGDTK